VIGTLHWRLTGLTKLKHPKSANLIIVLSLLGPTDVRTDTQIYCIKFNFCTFTIFSLFYEAHFFVKPIDFIKTIGIDFSVKSFVSLF